VTRARGNDDDDAGAAREKAARGEENAGNAPEAASGKAARAEKEKAVEPAMERTLDAIRKGRAAASSIASRTGEPILRCQRKKKVLCFLINELEGLKARVEKTHTYDYFGRRDRFFLQARARPQDVDEVVIAAHGDSVGPVLGGEKVASIPAAELARELAPCLKRGKTIIYIFSCHSAGYEPNDPDEDAATPIGAVVKGSEKYCLYIKDLAEATGCAVVGTTGFFEIKGGGTDLTINSWLQKKAVKNREPRFFYMAKPAADGTPPLSTVERLNVNKVKTGPFKYNDFMGAARALASADIPQAAAAAQD
jgi:hypothetical protein